MGSSFSYSWRCAVVALYALALIGCAEPVATPNSEIEVGAPSEEQALMRKIENLLKMPAGSEPIASYNRYYAMTETGQVRGVYLARSLPFDVDRTCPISTANELTSCTEGEQLDGTKATAEKMAQSGWSLWLASSDELPFVLDGGCSVIEVSYRPEMEILNARCNGVA
jgi:hypothetical protein